MIPELFDDELRRQLRARLSRRDLFPAMGISSVRRGTGRPCIVCAHTIDSPTLEREVEGGRLKKNFGLDQSSKRLQSLAATKLSSRW